jgi:hypothetical protein
MLDVYKQRMLAQQFQYVKYLNDAYQGYKFVGQAVERFDNSNFQGLAAVPGDPTSKNMYRRYFVTPDLDKFVTDALAQPADKPMLSMTLNKSSHRYHGSTQTWSAGASVWYGFWSFGANASGGRDEVDTNDAAFSLKVTARAVGAFTIRPDDWYSGTLVSAFKKGPWKPNGEIVQQKLNLWGPDGLLNLRTAQVIVAFQPSVSITMSASDYQRVSSHLDVNGGFSIGPFGFGGGYHTATTDITMNSATHTITATDNTNTPKIIAVVSNIINYP